MIGDLMIQPGSYSYADGEKYDGEWKTGEKHGTGSYSYTDGARYDGL